MRHPVAEIDLPAPLIMVLRRKALAKTIDRMAIPITEAMLINSAWGNYPPLVAELRSQRPDRAEP
jgi:hypothetical protein